jgi:hypothetical protein
MRAILLLLLAGCAATGGGSRGDAPFTDGELIDLMFVWREGERRRDPEMTQRALSFARSGDRSCHEKELAYLKGVPAGAIRVPGEFRLVCRAEGMREGDYLFLEPAGRTYAPTIVTIVRVRGKPRIRYERPDVTAEERAARRPEEVARLAAERRIDHWQALDGAELDKELARVRRMLRYQVEARAYAEREQLPVPPFAPDPAAILADLDGRDPAAARERVIAVLRGV